MELKKIKIAAALFALTAFCKLQAQEISPKIKEVGIGFYNFNSYSLQYRWGTEKRMYRINGAVSGQNKSQKDKTSNSTSFNGQTNESNNVNGNKSPFNFNINLGLSTIKMKAINEKFGFIHGALLGIRYDYSKLRIKSTTSSINNGILNSSQNSSVQTSHDVQPYIGIVIGAYYKLNKDFSIYAELNPNVYFDYNYFIDQTSTPENAQNAGTKNTRKSQNHNVGISGLTNSGASLTLAYRF